MTKDEILKAAKMITKDDVLNAAKCCAGDNCENCPLEHRGYEIENCVEVFANYILYNIKENEPALSANSTSSEVSSDTNLIHTDDNTKEQICQAYKTADEACSNILTAYEGMSECEQRAFDIGEAYGKICSTRDKLEKLRGEN